MIYAKDCDLYYMSIADYQKARKDEKDSTIVEVRLTTDGTPDFGYGIPYSTLNTDTLCNGNVGKYGGTGRPTPNILLRLLLTSGM